MDKLQTHKIYIFLFTIMGCMWFSSLYPMPKDNFDDYIWPVCYNRSRGGEFLVDGQEYPLAHTFENFISLVEKFEAANPDVTLSNELFFFLSNYTIENLKFVKTKFVPQSLRPPLDKYESEVKQKWKSSAHQGGIPIYNNAFESDEMCSLYFMLSHTLTTAATSRDDRVFSQTAPDEVAYADEQTPKTREQGVVAIRGSQAAVAIGPVLMGMYLGLQDGIPSKLKEFFKSTEINTIEKLNIDPLNMENSVVYPVYLLTLIDSLTWSKGLKTVDPDLDDNEFTENGNWLAVNNKPWQSSDVQDICPTVYELPDMDPKKISYSTASLVRGGADGLILGLNIKDFAEDNPKIRLGQVLRMYYSPRGFKMADNVSPASPKPISFCDRASLVDSVSDTWKSQVAAFSLLASTTFSEFDERRNDILQVFQDNKNNIFRHDTVLDDYCKKQIDGENVQSLPNETPVEVIVVLDTDGRNNGNLDKQSKTVGYLANKLDLWYGGSTITILTDERNGSSLTELVSKTFSSACAACHVTQKEIKKTGNSNTFEVLRGLDNLLKEMKSARNESNGAPGKAVVYFNYRTEESIDGNFDKAVKDFYANHRDVAAVAVGNDDKILSRFCGDRHQCKVLAVNEGETQLAEKISTHISDRSPAYLQYKDCKEARDEKNAVFEGLITPKSVQRWMMHAKYFEKSFTFTIMFEVEKDGRDGNIKVCSSRSAMPESDCQTTDATNNVLKFEKTDPCKGFSSNTCSHMYFTVIGLEDDGKQTNTRRYCQDTKDEKCKTVDQIKFKVYHEGVRCSGCSALLSAPVVLILTLLSYMVCTKNN